MNARKFFLLSLGAAAIWGVCMALLHNLIPYAPFPVVFFLGLLWLASGTSALIAFFAGLLYWMVERVRKEQLG